MVCIIHDHKFLEIAVKLIQHKRQSPNTRLTETSTRQITGATHMYIMMGIRIELSAVHTVNRYPAYVAIRRYTVILAQAYGIACIIDWLYEPGLHNLQQLLR